MSNTSRSLSGFLSNANPKGRSEVRTEARSPAPSDSAKGKREKKEYCFPYEVDNAKRQKSLEVICSKQGVI
jgi:hypothetical protein